ncbi:MAG: hypothetical protein ISS26_05265 [Candidatus Omnitrophica bacterium]|nr:hypothetical protein [Candidatus Omnitrophota bacterium]
MKDYLSDFKADIAQITPNGLCPLLYHTLIPYIVTLLDGGWFGWIEKKKDTNYRKKIDPKDFNKSSVDRLYPNEVLVQCPNINASIIVGVGPYINSRGEREVLLRILNKKGECPNNLEIGNEIILNKNDFKISPTEYNAGFPSLLLSRLSGKESLSDHFCNNPLKNRSVSVEDIEARCRYHKKKSSYADSLLPGDFCMDIFHLIYPQVLALLYSSDKKMNNFTYSCPISGERVTIKAEKVPRFNTILGGFRKILIKIFKAVFFPYDFIDDNIVFTVEKSRDVKDCALDEKKKYYFNMFDERYPCPSSLHALYPYMLLRAHNMELPWSDVVHCPGCKGITYSIK